MKALIIYEKDLERNSIILMKDFYDYIYNDYFLNEDEIFKKQRKYYDENMTKEYLKFYENNDFYSILYKKWVKMETKELIKK